MWILSGRNCGSGRLGRRANSCRSSRAGPVRRRDDWRRAAGSEANRSFPAVATDIEAAASLYRHGANLGRLGHRHRPGCRRGDRHGLLRTWPRRTSRPYGCRSRCINTEALASRPAGEVLPGGWWLSPGTGFWGFADSFTSRPQLRRPVLTQEPSVAGWMAFAVQPLFIGWVSSTATFQTAASAGRAARPVRIDGRYQPAAVLGHRGVFDHCPRPLLRRGRGDIPSRRRCRGGSERMMTLVVSLILLFGTLATITAIAAAPGRPHGWQRRQ